MENSEQPGSGGRPDWPIRIATAVGILVAVTLGLLFKFDLGSFWLAMVAFLVVVAVGAVLGRLAGFLLFRR